MNSLINKIEEVYSHQTEELGKTELDLFEQFKSLLNSGEIRSAEKVDGKWQLNQWVKKGILLGFRLGQLVDCSIDAQFRFFDKSTYPLKKIQLDDKIRQVPGGSSPQISQDDRTLLPIDIQWHSTSNWVMSQAFLFDLLKDH